MKAHLNFQSSAVAWLVAVSLLGLTAFAQAPATVDMTPRKISFEGAEIYAVGFDKLSSFPYTIVDAGTGASAEEIKAAMTKDQVPPAIRVYHDQRVMITGYLMPLQIEKGLTKKFVIMKDVNTCCFGSVPNMNDYVVVTMKGAGITPLQDVPVDLVGTFKVDQKYEGGYVVSLFTFEGEKFLGAKK
ncbi:MAG: hypothetical protein QM760_07785 [Nibricoccus sp.]